EEGLPAVFDRYSNSFLRIYFPIPPGRENEIARKVLITHLQSGNSYGIQLKEKHCKFPQPELGPWVEHSRTVGADWHPPGVEVWESDPAAYHYNPVGYLALGAAVQESDLVATYERQERIGYRSQLIVGEGAVDEHMKALFPDWRAKGVTVCLHEQQGGFAFNMDSVLGLAGKCESEDVSILSGIEVMELELGSDGTVT